MNDRPRLPLEGQPTAPTGPQAAEPAGGTPGRSALKVAARKGVLTALRPDPQPSTPPGDGRTPIAWLHVIAPPDWRAVPSAVSSCACGCHRTAKGRAAVQRLIEAHTAHHDTCPLRAPQEGRAAA